MLIRNLLGAAVCFAALVAPQSVYAQMSTINATGKAAIVGKKPDPNLILNSAMDDARRGVTKKLLIEAIGIEEANKVPLETLDALKEEISPTALRVVGGPTQIGTNYVVDVTAAVDREWFRKTMVKYKIQTSSRRLGNSATIAMKVDLTYGVSRDLSQPKEVVTEFSSSKGASYSDTSMAASSEKYKDASSDSYKQGSSAGGSAAAGVSGYSGSAAARSGYSGSQASSSKSASASSYSNSEVQKNNVQAEVHDDVNYRNQVVNQDASTQQGADEDAITAVGSTASRFGLSVQSTDRLSSKFFGGRAPSWADLRKSPRYDQFLEALSRDNVKFLLGGTLKITDGGPSTTGRFVTCSGSISIMAETTARGKPPINAISNQNATDSGGNAQECENNLVAKLGKLAGEEIGEAVQDYWLQQGEDQSIVADNTAATNAQATQSAYAQVANGADYTLTFAAPNGLDYMAARQIGQMLQEIPGIEKVARLSLTANEVVYQVFYKAKTELDGAIMDKLLPVQALSAMRPQELNGTRLTFCVAGCN